MSADPLELLTKTVEKLMYEIDGVCRIGWALSDNEEKLLKEVMTKEIKAYGEQCVTIACNDCYEGSGLSLSDWVKKKEKEGDS